MASSSGRHRTLILWRFADGVPRHRLDPLNWSLGTRPWRELLDEMMSESVRRRPPRMQWLRTFLLRDLLSRTPCGLIARRPPRA